MSLKTEEQGVRGVLGSTQKPSDCGDGTVYVPTGESSEGVSVGTEKQCVTIISGLDPRY